MRGPGGRRRRAPRRCARSCRAAALGPVVDARDRVRETSRSGRRRPRDHRSAGSASRSARRREPQERRPLLDVLGQRPAQAVVDEGLGERFERLVLVPPRRAPMPAVVRRTTAPAADTRRRRPDEPLRPLRSMVRRDQRTRGRCRLACCDRRPSNSRSWATIILTSVVEVDLGRPPELRSGLGGVADQQVDLGGAEELRVLPDVALPVVDAGLGERALDELMHRVRLAGRDDVVVGLVLLQHQPHRLARSRRRSPSRAWCPGRRAPARPAARA